MVIAREDMVQFTGKTVTGVSGTAKIDMKRLKGKKLKEIRTWGKHLLLCFDGFTIRVHFLMFGTYRINEKKDAEPRLALKFKKEELNFYTSAVKMLEEPLDDIYDWKADVMTKAWDPKAARRKLKKEPGTLVADALLDQQIFSGVGNIIKNEVLFRIEVHPESTIGALPPRKLTQMINEASNYAFDFLKWKKENTLKKHWLAHTKRTCPRDGGKITKEYIGITNRRTFFCENCQKKYV